MPPWRMTEKTDHEVGGCEQPGAILGVGDREGKGDTARRASRPNPG